MGRREIEREGGKRKWKKKMKKEKREKREEREKRDGEDHGGDRGRTRKRAGRA
jgi:hypothetical protein